MISLYTTCKGRLHHLKETLQHNVKSISGVPNAEIVVIDYGSPDGLSKWMFDNRQYINDGLVNYYRYDSVGNFHIAHAKNLGVCASANPIVCSVDADCYVDRGLVDQLLVLKTGEFCSVCHTNWEGSLWGCIGGFKSDVCQVGGYNEVLTGYGFDDIDLANKLLKIGLNKIPWDVSTLRSIQHPRDESMKFYVNKSCPDSIEANKKLSLGGATSTTWGGAVLKKNFSKMFSSRSGSLKEIKLF